MDVQVVNDEVYGLRSWIIEGQLRHELGEFGGTAIRCRAGIVLASFRFHGAEHIGGSAPLVLAVALGNLARAPVAWAIAHPYVA